MSGHRHYRRRRGSSESWSTGSRSTSRTFMRASTTETDDDDVHGGHRRRKRSSASLPVRQRSHHSWVLLNRPGAQLDEFPGDRATSAMSRTSNGAEISVSFELVEPPGTSVLTVNDSPRASTTSTTSRTKFSGSVIAAHRDVVLLEITSYEDSEDSDVVTDLFVYQACRDPSRRSRRPPSLSLLLLPSLGGPEIYSEIGIGIMSCTSNDDADDSPSPSFVVAELQMCDMCPQGTSNEVRLFRSGSGKWEYFKNLHVHGANGGRDLRCWFTNAVVPYGRRRCMIWVDYYRGMVLMDLSSSQFETTNPETPPPRLRYVPLPVDSVEDPDDIDFGRGCPEACRRVCVTRHGIKFVSVDSQHWSNFGVGYHNVLKWNHRFRVTTWSLCLREDDDYSYRWRRDATMHEEEFWDAFDGGRHRVGFPHVEPSFPVIDMDNPDVVVFQLEKLGSLQSVETKWMIEVDMRKKVLLAATAYSNKESDDLYGDAEAINSARMISDFDTIPSELPRYLDGGQACKKRRQ